MTKRPEPSEHTRHDEGTQAANAKAVSLSDRTRRGRSSAPRVLTPHGPQNRYRLLRCALTALTTLNVSDGAEGAGEGTPTLPPDAPPTRASPPCPGRPATWAYTDTLPGASTMNEGCGHTLVMN